VAPSLTPRERTHLKGKAHTLECYVHVGHAGLTDAVVAEVDKALAVHELLKVRLTGNRDERDELIAELCARTDAAQVQSVGKVLVLWRPRPDADAR
jgi:putative YhbY family RNA-binding protein